MTLAILFIVAGAIWRFIDGQSRDSTGIATGLRNAVTILLAVTAALAGGLHWWSLWAGGWAAASIIIGETRWERATWQAIRFGGLAAVAVLPIGIAGLPYVLACALAGASYTALGQVDDHLPRWRWLTGFEAYARFILGAAVIGGLAALFPLLPP